MTTETSTPQEPESETASVGAARIKTVKAGCGIRFDPDELNADTGFDFSGAAELLDDAKEAAVPSDDLEAPVNPTDS